MDYGRGRGKKKNAEKAWGRPLQNAKTATLGRTNRKQTCLIKKGKEWKGFSVELEEANSWGYSKSYSIIG